MRAFFLDQRITLYEIICYIDSLSALTSITFSMSFHLAAAKYLYWIYSTIITFNYLKWINKCATTLPWKCWETSIMNLIKAIRAIKSRPDELSISDIVYRANPSLDIYVTINSLKTWFNLKTNHPLVKVPITSLNIKTRLVTEWTYLIPNPLPQKY